MRKLLFIYLVLLTGVRVVDLTYVLTRSTTNLPIVVFVLTIALTLLGVLLIIKKLVRALFLRDFRRYFIINALITLFNLFYITVKVPLQLRWAEVLVAGSFVGVFIDICIIYICQRRLNQTYISVDLNNTPPKNGGEYTLVVFDLDGTLVNSLEDIADSCNYALRKLGFPEHPTSTIRDFVGDGVLKLVTRMLPEAERLNPNTVEQALIIYREHYKANISSKTVVYDGILPLLETLHEKEIHTAVLSNKPHEDTLTVVKTLLGDRIELAFGERKNISRKPSPQGLLEIIEFFSAAPEQVLYIGDTTVDIQTGWNAGVDTVGVGWGFRPAEVLQTAGANYIARTPEELENIIFGK